MIIAIDGPAGSGKSTLAKNLAKRLDLMYLNTGATYRAVALAARRAGIHESQSHELTALIESNDIDLRGEPDDMHVFLNDEDITGYIQTPEISDLASRISAVPEVRRALVALQRRIAAGKDVVTEGRDTATVVFPNADLKVYLDASIDERAKRRSEDWKENIDLEKIKYEIAMRDDRDRTRCDSPLRVAEGALIIDSTTTQPEDVVETVIKALYTRGLL